VLGDSNLYSIAYLSAGDIASTETFGLLRLQAGDVRITPGSALFESAIGAHTLLPGNVNLLAPSLAYLSAMGAPGFIFDAVYGVLIVALYNQTVIETYARNVANLHSVALPEAKIAVNIFAATRIEAKSYPAVSIETEVRRYYENEP
jgi:hypothetical protein